MLVDGRRVVTRTAFEVIDPATEKVIGQAPEADEAAIAASLLGAERGFKAWAAMSPARRKSIILRYAQLLEANRERLIDLLRAETGKPRENAEYDFGMLPACLRYFVEEAERLDQPVLHDPEGRFLHFVQRQPLGIVVGFLAWNFPLLNLGYKLGPVLAAGCAAIIKPSSLTPLATLEAAHLSREAGVPDGAVNVITSSRHEVMQPLLRSHLPAMVTMIGSTRAGLEVVAGSCSSVKRFSVELGGNAPVIVYPDADLRDAALKIVNLKFANSGQVCVSPNRCFVHRSAVEPFLRHAAGRAAEISMGPMISEERRRSVLELVRSAVVAGAKVVCGGNAPPGRGFFLEPTILRDVSPGMAVAREEIFGPVLPVIAYDDNEDVVALANDAPQGLAAYVFTRSLAHALRAARDLQAGSICVNEPHYSVQLPHGGLKQSGVGKDCSRYSLEEYLTLKRISILLEATPPAP